MSDMVCGYERTARENVKDFTRIISLGKERHVCARVKGKKDCYACKRDYGWVGCLEWTRYLGFWARLYRKLNGLSVLPKEATSE